MNKIEIKNTNLNTGSGSIEKVCTESDFLSLTAEDLIIQHHLKKSDFTYYYFQPEVNSLLQPMCFLLSQDSELIKELKMLKFDKKVDPKRTLDLFSDNQEQLASVSIAILLENLENNQLDTQLSIDGRDYSFRLVVGTKVKKLIKCIEDYVEEVENIREYSDLNKPKI